QARARFDELLRLADDRGEAWSYARLRLGLCEVELRAGEWQTAAGLLEDWAQSPDRELLTAPAYGRCRALVALGRGRPDEAERWAAGAIASSEASGLGWDLLEARRVRGLAALLAGDCGLAVESLRAVWVHNEREGVARARARSPATAEVASRARGPRRSRDRLRGDRLRRLDGAGALGARSCRRTQADARGRPHADGAEGRGARRPGQREQGDRA